LEGKRTDLVPPWKYEEPLCAEIGAELFYIEDKDEKVVGQRLNAYVDAKKICLSCSHLKECGAWAIQNEKHGFWGGYSPEERKQIRSKLNIILKEDVPNALYG
jgi:hypothetical protein